MKKIDFNKRHIRSVICFTIVFLFFGILMFFVPVVHAEENDSEPIPIPSGYVSLKSRLSGFEYNFFSNETCFGEDAVPAELAGYTDVFYEHDSDNIFLNPDLYDEDLSNGEVIIDANSINRNYEGYTYIYDEQNNHFTTTHVTDLSVSGFDDYALTYSNATLQLWLFDQCGEVDSYKNNIAPVNACGFYFNDGSSLDSISYKYPFIKLNSVTQNVSGVPGIYVLKTTDYDTMNYGQTFKVGLGTSSYDKIAFYGNSGIFINSNIPLYWTDFNQRNLDGNAYQTNQVPAGNGGANVELKSEIFGDPHYSITITNSVGGSTTYPDGSGGDNTNNMYMETADWKFDIPRYWNHDTNSPIKSNWGKGTVSFYGLVNDYIIDHADEYSLNFDFYIKFNGKHAQPGIEDGGEPVYTSFAHSYALRNVSVPLQDFLDSNNLYSWNVQFLFENAIDNDGYNILNTDDYYGVYEKFKNFDWDISCSAHLIAGNYTSGAIQEKYSFITQISKEVANTITENHNPYYPEDENGNPQLPDSDSSSSSTVDRYGNIILTNNDNDNNNQVVTINGNDKTVVDRLVNKLIPEFGTNGGLIEPFSEYTNQNGWFVVMSSALPLMGTQFWQMLQVIFITSVGIIGIAFALWIIVHII